MPKVMNAALPEQLIINASNLPTRRRKWLEIELSMLWNLNVSLLVGPILYRPVVRHFHNCYWEIIQPACNTEALCALLNGVVYLPKGYISYSYWIYSFWICNVCNKTYRIHLFAAVSAISYQICCHFVSYKEKVNAYNRRVSQCLIDKEGWHHNNIKKPTFVFYLAIKHFTTSQAGVGGQAEGGTVRLGRKRMFHWLCWISWDSITYSSYLSVWLIAC